MANLTKKDINNTLLRLSEDERNEIERLARQLVEKVHGLWDERREVNTGIYFGRLQALELLAQLGILMVENPGIILDKPQ